MKSSKGSLFILYNKNYELLLQHRTDDAPRYPGYWGLFGGSIEGDETPEEGLKREAEEELQITFKNVILFKTYKFLGKVRYVYLMPANWPIEILRRQQQEGQDLGFFTYQETKKLKRSLLTKIVLAQVNTELKKSIPGGISHFAKAS